MAVDTATEHRIIPLRVALAHRVATTLPDCRSRYYPGEGHLFVFDRTHEVLAIAVRDEAPAR